MSRRKRRQREATRRTRARRRAQRMPRPGPRSAVLQALTSSALALPGMAARASAESGPVEFRTDYRYSRYTEDGIDSSKVTPGGETDRYEIDIHQFLLDVPIGERYGLGVELAHETMSGATPWYILPPSAPGEAPLQVMTGATIDEARTDVLVTGRRLLDEGVASLSGGVSLENDYLALNGSVGGEREFNEKNTTLSGGLGGSFDQLSPQDTDKFPERPDHEDRWNVNLFLGLSQILGRASAIQTSFKYQHNQGFLSDPYKLSVVNGAPLPDARPDARNQFSWLTRFRHHWSSLDATLHFDYKLYFDDWDINSHTFELAWYQTFFDSFRLVPSFRYYSQSQADFYAPFYTVARSDGLRSSDYRLSPFGAISWTIRGETRVQIWSYVWDIGVSYERYTSKGDLALGSVAFENPGLVAYDLLSVGLTARF